MSDHDIIPLVSVAGAFIVAISCTAIYFAYLAWKTYHETTLKRDMVARGYTAEEIAAVIAATTVGCEGESPVSKVPPAKPIKQPAFGP
jgi:hypothetical protein